MSRQPNPEELYETLVAACTPEQSNLLIQYDHHRVMVHGRAAVMLTYHWMLSEDQQTPLLLKVVFQYADQHPPAPPEIQAIINQLTFQSA